MKAAIHYLVKANLIRRVEEGEMDFIEINKKFEDADPIKAREKAFAYYQNYIDVLLEGVGEKYHTHKAAEKALSPFIIYSGFDFKFQQDELSSKIKNGIGIFLVIDVPIENEEWLDEPSEEYMIHGIGFLEGHAPQQLMDSLYFEFKYYLHYGYDFKDYKIQVNFCEEDFDEAEVYEILKTPFDWTGYELPAPVKEATEAGNEIKEEKKEPTKTFEEHLRELIDEGEGNQVEFKPTMLYYYDKEGQRSGYSRVVKHIIARTIASFLNSKGGCLFIGVQDDKSLAGLDDDFSLVRPTGKDPRDYFKLGADKLIREYFKENASNITGNFVTIYGVEIFVFIVFPAKRGPVFISRNDRKEFYVRLMGSNEPYRDVEKIVNYCLERWGNLNPDDEE